MANKIIAIADINSFCNQNIETLLFACILEKKVNKLSVLDLNHYEQDKLLPEREEWKKEGEILTTQIFSNTSYQISTKTALEQNKILNLAKALSDISDILLINSNANTFDYNTQFYNCADEIVLFADLEQDINRNLINFFMRHALKNKKIYLFVHNYKLNIQSEKTYLYLLKQFKAPNIIINNIDAIPQFKTLEEIENVDPWLDIYKKINSAF